MSVSAMGPPGSRSYRPSKPLSSGVTPFARLRSLSTEPALRTSPSAGEGLSMGILSLSRVLNLVGRGVEGEVLARDDKDEKRPLLLRVQNEGEGKILGELEEEEEEEEEGRRGVGAGSLPKSFSSLSFAFVSLSRAPYRML